MAEILPSPPLILPSDPPPPSPTSATRFTSRVGGLTSRPAVIEKIAPFFYSTPAARVASPGETARVWGHGQGHGPAATTVQSPPLGSTVEVEMLRLKGANFPTRARGACLQNNMIYDTGTIEDYLQLILNTHIQILDV
ncbi:hypothetical protein Bbelb_013360 [Branchiostoma belcheri]|nr:hypothetical protein Bbelb_013360 [Branchiostoma belcheri]